MSSTSTSRSPSSSSGATTLTSVDEIDRKALDKRSIRKSSDRFNRWRPYYHLIAPHGWMNDPCAPGCDPETGQYRVSFQWNPHGPDWGNISWGSATSSDLTTWNVSQEPSLCPDKAYDREGVFTGCLVHGRDGSMHYVYTSVNALPIHHTLPRIRGCESLSIAHSLDHGRTWTKSSQNPILPSEPAQLDVTGWRDPFVAPWPEMCALLGYDPESTILGLISGGIRNTTPTTFLYAIDALDLTKWTYIGPLLNVGLDQKLSRWSGSLARNWEVTNFVTVVDDIDPSIRRTFLLIGSEGHGEDRSGVQRTAEVPTRPNREQVWLCGSLRLNVMSEDPLSTPVSMTQDFGGILDHGCMYAANSFFDPPSQKQIVCGWIGEDDLCDELRHQQGWSGMLSLPRELFLQTIQHVVGTCAHPLASVAQLRAISSIEVEVDERESCTVRTLASLPCLKTVEDLRSRRRMGQTAFGPCELMVDSQCLFLNDIQTTTWELDSVFCVSERCRNVGLRVQHSEDSEDCTVLSFAVATETFTIHRSSKLENASQINTDPLTAPHTLFRSRNPSTGIESTETLQIRAWRDNSVLEVFVNCRTAISARIYSSDAAEEATDQISFFADDGSPCSAGDADLQEDHAGTHLLSATVWDGLGAT